MRKRAALCSPSTSNPIMSVSSSMPISGSKSISAGNFLGLRSARSHASSSTRWRIDLITDGSALAYSMMSAEFEKSAALDAAGRAVEQIAVDHAAQLRRRQRVVAAHQILDLEAAVLADRLQRRDDV